jgi:hypothetical protein
MPSHQHYPHPPLEIFSTFSEIAKTSKETLQCPFNQSTAPLVVFRGLWISRRACLCHWEKRVTSQKRVVDRLSDHSVSFPLTHYFYSINLTLRGLGLGSCCAYRNPPEEEQLARPQTSSIPLCNRNEEEIAPWQ